MHRLAWLFLPLVASCATLKKDQTVCPEYRNLRCAAGSTCSMDQGRGCKVCQCDDMTGLSPANGPDDNALPPPGE